MLVIRDIVTTRDTWPHDNIVTSLSTAAREGEGESGGGAEDCQGPDEGGAQNPGQA